MSEKMIFGPKGKPWSSKEAAFSFLVEKKKMDYSVVKHGGGWALANTLTLEPEDEVKKTAPPMTYSKVIFSPRQSRTEPEQIQLSVNGVTLVVTRGVETILPESHLEVARHCTHRSYFYDEKNNEMIDNGYIMKYPYQTLGSVTEKEYQDFLKAGNEIRDKDLKTH